MDMAYSLLLLLPTPSLGFGWVEDFLGMESPRLITALHNGLNTPLGVE